MSKELNRVVKFFGRLGEADDKGCQAWQGAADKYGYGKVTVEGKTIKAHRFALYLATGRLGDEACHTCDNPICCNPRHLFWGSKSDNMRDRADKGRQAGGRQGTGKVSDYEKMDRLIDKLLKEQSK